MARRQCLAVIAAGAILAPVASPAQTPQAFPREVLEPQVPQQPRPQVQEGLQVTPPPVAEAPAAGGPTFTLEGLDVQGSTVYGAADFDALVADSIGQPVDFAGLRTITDRIEALYRDDGFLAVRAVVPAQRIAGGRVRIEVIEASVREVVIQGELGRAEPEVRRILSQLIDRKPLSSVDTERQLLLARDLPGVSLLAALRPRGNEAPGELVLLVEGALTAVDGFLSFSNFASDFAGPFVATLGGSVNSLAFSGDRLQLVGLAALDPGEELLGQLIYDVPLVVDGLRLRVSASNSISESGAELEPLDIDYRSEIIRAGLEYQLIRSRARTVSVGGGLEYVHQESNALIEAIEVDEDLRVLFFEAGLVESDVFGGTLDAGVEVRHGLNVLGANERGDDNLTGVGDTNPQFVSAGFDFLYGRALPAGFSLQSELSAQVSSGSLPTFERFSLGNYTIGRGFDPGSLTGDHGVAASVTISYALDLPEIPNVSGTELFSFVDTGRVFSEGLSGSAGLTSWGAGARWQLFEQVSAEVFLAVPVQASDIVQDDNPSGLFRVTAFF